MRKLFTPFVSTLFLISINLQAQIKKGSLLLGGDLSFYSFKNDVGSQEYTANNFYFSPSIGKAIKDNTFIGMRVNVGFNKNYPGINTAGDSKGNSFGAGIFYRKYKSIKNNFYLFLEGNMSANFSKTDYDNGPDSYYTQKNKLFSANFYPGISYQISRKLFLEGGFRDILGISYSNEKRNGNSFGGIINTKINSFSISSSLNNFNSALSIGFRLLVNKETKKK